MKLHTENIQYFYNDRCVICRIQWSYGTDGFLTEDLMEMVRKKFPRVRNHYDSFKFTTTGIAKCSPYDTFDKVTGKRIAESRASSKAYTLVWRILVNYRAYLERKAMSLESEIHKRSLVCAKEEAHYENIIGDKAK